MDVTYLGALIAGLLSFLSPCVLPLVPPYLCFLGGTTFDQLTGEDETPAHVYQTVVLSSVAFVLGFTTVFVILGATATVLGQLVVENLPLLSKIAGVIIIIAGLHFLGVIHIPLLHREARYHADTRPAGLVGAYVIGLAFAFGWTPCIGPVLGAILAVAAGEDSVRQGVSLLFVYSLGLGIPFILAAVAIRPFMSALQRFRGHLAMMEKVLGAFLVLTGILFLTNSMTLIAGWLLQTFPSLATIG
ncbi:MAG TPA: cytochrome c biogenesis CcdA family protein [Methyloceanibacter sp.]|nr:cytochrome c biogenesis CcdA family protein [Methyloceanibacter sp.]